MKNIKLTYIIPIGFIITSLVMIVLWLVGSAGMKQMSSSTEQLYEKSYIATSNALEAQNAIFAIQKIMDVVSIAQTQAAIDAASSQTVALEKNILAKFDLLRETAPKQQALCDYLNAMFDQWREDRAKIADIAKQKIQNEGTNRTLLFVRSIRYNNMSNDTASELIATLDTIIASSKDEAKDFVQANVSQKEQASNIFIVALITALVIAISISIAAFNSAKSVTLPLEKLSKIIIELSKGNRNIAIPYTNLQNEVGVLAKAAEVLRGNIIEKEALSHREARNNADSKVERQNLLRNVANKFERKALKSVSEISLEAKNTQDMSSGLLRMMKKTSQTAEQAQQSCSEANSYSIEISDATSSLASSVVEVSHKVTSANVAAKEAVELVNTGHETLGLLLGSSDKINDISALISGIAAKTNLLALNATVEAARAGEVGKGFAVVASEVKELAKQTAQATVEISDNISIMQDSVNKTAMSMDAIGDSISMISTASDDIVDRVNLQKTITESINNNSQQSMQKISSAFEAVGNMNNAMVHTKTSANDVHGSSKVMLDTTQNLEKHVSEFLETVQAS